MTPIDPLIHAQRPPLLFDRKRREGGDDSDQTGLRREVYARATKIDGPSDVQYTQTARTVRGEDSSKGSHIDLLL